MAGFEDDEAPDLSTRAGRIVFLRESLGLTQEEFTAEVSAILRQRGQPPVTRGAISGWESGKGVAVKNLNAVAALAETSIDWIENAVGSPPDDDRLAAIGRNLGYGPTARGPFGQLILPGQIAVVGQGAGATLDQGAVLLFDQDPMGWLPMLPGLARMEDVYALEITGTSMVPMFKPREPIYVSPHLKPQHDDAMVVVEHRTRNGNPVCFVKIFVKETRDAVIGRQLNPPLEIAYQKKPGISVHRVLTLPEVLGYGTEPPAELLNPGPHGRRR